KDSVRFKILTPNMIQLLKFLAGYAEITEKTWVITSANDSRHASDSRHYLDRAIDLRSRTKTPTEIEGLVKNVFNVFGDKIRIKIELDKNDRHWVTSADEIRFPPGERWSNQHIHIEVS
ncbi:MAG: hypothetical protein R3182_13945, partial [Draconibacterium sp.]|nr:hypothetical protein [Draconibacterium sp.]